MFNKVWNDSRGVIYQGHNLEILKTLPDNSVDMVITSPPYWALRVYATEAQIWDGDPNCEHSWGKTIRYAKEDKRTPEEKKSQGAVVGNSVNSINFAVGDSGAFCTKCGAWKGEIGLEPDFNLYVKHLCDIFDEVKRVLKTEGTCWVNIGDTYNSGGDEELESKCLCQIPSRFAIEMGNRGWILRNEIIWHKPNAMPTSAKDRFTVDFEKIYFFVKSKKYYFEQQFEPHTSLEDLERRSVKEWKTKKAKDTYAVSGTGRSREELYGEFGRNKRTVWSITTKPTPEAHFAIFPADLIEIPIKSGCPKDGYIMDIFNGSGTTCVEAKRLGRKYIGLELNPEYCKLAIEKLRQEVLW